MLVDPSEKSRLIPIGEVPQVVDVKPSPRTGNGRKIRAGSTTDGSGSLVSKKLFSQEEDPEEDKDFDKTKSEEEPPTIEITETSEEAPKIFPDSVFGGSPPERTKSLRKTVNRLGNIAERKQEFRLKLSGSECSSGANSRCHSPKPDQKVSLFEAAQKAEKPIETRRKTRQSSNESISEEKKVTPPKVSPPKVSKRRKLIERPKGQKSITDFFGKKSSSKENSLLSVSTVNARPKRKSLTKANYKV